MSQNQNTLHKESAVLIGTGNFLFSENAVSAADAATRGFVDFGAIEALQFQNQLEKAPIVLPFQGIRRQVRQIPTLINLGYKLTLLEFDHRNARHPLYAAEGTPFTQAALVTANGDALPFNVVAAVLNTWYELRYGGVRVREISLVTIAGKVEGADFIVDKKRGLIRFLTAQNAALTPVISAPIVTSASAGYLRSLTPLQKGVRRGYGRLTIYDQHDDSIVAYEHVGFSCELTCEAQPQVDGKAEAKPELMVQVTETVGEVLIRE